jgi:MoaA/NifB/PqqE/SkfB family radical SAM enzyme
MPEDGRRLVDHANRAAEQGEERLRFVLEEAACLPTVLRAVKDLRRLQNLSIELAVPGSLDSDPALARAAALLKLRLIALDSDGLKVHDPAWLIAHPEALPHDYLLIHDRAMAGETIREALLRPTYRCNERCGFCWIHDDQQDVPADTTRAIVRELATQGVRRLTISGGEPTLSADLPELIATAREAGMSEVVLQTNGVLLADSRRVKRLKDAGLTEVFLALHGHTAELSDAITGLAGGFDKTLAALRHLLAARLPLVLDHVITNKNVAMLELFADFALAEADRAQRSFAINFAVAQPLGRYEQAYVASTPRLSVLREHLLAAFTRLHKSSVEAIGFTSACGPPLCAVRGRDEFMGRLEPIAEAGKESARDFIKAPACATCRLTDYCLGLRRIYADAFGLDEIEPV